MLKKKK